MNKNALDSNRNAKENLNCVLKPHDLSIIICYHVTGPM